GDRAQLNCLLSTIKQGGKAIALSTNGAIAHRLPSNTTAIFRSLSIW
ncbi:MAG: hypothetical protein F6K30_23680, partial [Cyanothece sp. SIO2G6]|nr:hypothetical protein [Cyanothece sp. SIO2G6]